MNPDPVNPGRFEVQIASIDDKKNVVFDERALAVLNERVTEKSKQFSDARDPRVRGYIKEFVGRMASELYKNGLMELEDIDQQEGSPEDPYSKAKRLYGKK
jgi:hypothetical protein